MNNTMEKLNHSQKQDLIADFMGLKQYEAGISSIWSTEPPKRECDGEVHTQFLPYHYEYKSILRYHYSWDELVPVIRKINETAENMYDTAPEGYIVLFQGLQHAINEALVKLDIQKAFDAAVKFIKAYKSSRYGKI